MTLTSGYPWFCFPFAEFNPVQEKCLPYFAEDCNIILSASVAAGKTAVAEAVMGHCIGSLGRKAVYVSPLKAIGREKFNQWSRPDSGFGKVRLEYLDGDHRKNLERLERASLVVATAEALRFSAVMEERWLRDAGCLVLDEAHLLGDPQRGVAAETMMMDFSEIAPSARLCLLSGTMPNAREIAEWCKRLNGKPTRYFCSSWRPTPLDIEICPAEGFAETDALAARLAGGGSKSLIFVHSKAAGKRLRDYLKRHGARCAFFHAGLPAKSRDRMLSAYRSPYSGLDILVATSSLAMGVGL